MRITENNLVSRILADITAADQRRMATHMQVSSGRRLNRPSDDPIGVIASLRHRTNIGMLRQFQANAADARDWLSATEAALKNATDLIQRAKEIAVEGANSHLPPGAFQALAEEVRQLRDELIQLGNVAHGDRFIFGGHQTQQPPFDAAGNYLGDAAPADILREIGPGVTVSINLLGDQVFSQALTVFAQLATDLQNGDVAAVGADIGALEGELDRFLSFRSQVGAKMNRLELALQRLQDMELSVTQLQSTVEDADLAETAVRLAMQENAYQAALAAAARLVQPTLLDFLR